MLFGHMSIITPATVINIQYKLPYAKYKYLGVTWQFNRKWQDYVYIQCEYKST